MISVSDQIDFAMYVGIDWSGAKHPMRTHSISLSWCKKGNEPPQWLDGPLSRKDVADWIIKNATLPSRGRVLIGIDCNLGYSADIITDQFGIHAAASDLWHEVDALNQRDDNFNAELFWKNQKYKKYFWVSGKTPDWYNQRNLRRMTERKCISDGLGVPECPFKFIGPKQVGKGGLSGMRLVKFLSEYLKEKICIWPFQNITDTTQIVIAEIYPRLFWNKTGMRNVKVSDMETLNRALYHFNSRPIHGDYLITDHKSDAAITSVGLRDFIQSRYAKNNLLFDIPDNMLPIVKSEGWIFGVNTHGASS